MPVELTERLLSNAAGWEAMKRARAYLEQDQVLSSFWEPPLLRGVVQSGDMTFRASMVIKGSVDMENLCNCREAREWGKICGHVVAVGLHWLKSQQPSANMAPPARPGATPAATRTPRASGPRISRDADGTPAELFIILPPNFVEAAARGKVMLVFEAAWDRSRAPLNALPKNQSFAFGGQDARLIDRAEELAGESPAML